MPGPLSDPVRICLVGVSNFAQSHSGSIQRMVDEGLAILSCAVVRSPDKYAEAVANYKSRGVTVYTSYPEMLEAEKGNTELVALPVAIPDHGETSVMAMEAGYHVLCEKPPAATIEQLDAMIETSERTGKVCCIGFQNQSKNTVRALKQAVCDGKLGEIEHIEVMATWVRKDSYYHRNDWAGKLIWQGKYCLDGPTQNALAHYLFNALYWASPRWLRADDPVRVRGEMYHAHPIESSDLGAVKMETAGGVDITYLVTLAGWENIGPLSRVYGTKGMAEWSMSGPTILRIEGQPEQVIDWDRQREHDEVFRNAILYIRGLTPELNCPAAMTRPYTVAVNAGFQSNGRPTAIPAEFVTRYEEEGGDVFTAINDIEAIIRRGYEERKTYSDMGIAWARETPWVDTRDYREFKPEF